MGSSSAPLPTREGPGSVSGAPNLPVGFTGTFTSRYVNAGGLRQHAVVAALTEFLAPCRQGGGGLR